MTIISLMYEDDSLRGGRPVMDRQLSAAKPVWKSCCFVIDKRMFLFCAQLSISLIILLFCVFKLYKSDTCEAQSLYGNMLITLLGLWMPSPLTAKK